MPNLRCSRCKAKGQVEFQIVFVGGSGEALFGCKASKIQNTTGKSCDGAVTTEL